MVGDTLHTDIIGGNKFGLDTVLVLSGNTLPETPKCGYAVPVSCLLIYAQMRWWRKPPQQTSLGLSAGFIALHQVTAQPCIG